MRPNIQATLMRNNLILDLCFFPRFEYYKIGWERLRLSSYQVSSKSMERAIAEKLKRLGA